MLASASSCEIEMLQDSPDVCVEPEGWLEWTLPDTWDKLATLPRDFCISSPLFGVQQAPCLQLIFYPSGCRTSEGGQCSLALNCGPDSAGLKFEALINGVSSEPQECLGQRYVGDFPQPAINVMANGEQRVVIRLHILETIGDQA